MSILGFFLFVRGHGSSTSDELSFSGMHLQWLEDNMYITSELERGGLGPWGCRWQGGKRKGVRGSWMWRTRIGRVVPQEEQNGGCSSLDVTGGLVEQQCRTDFCVPT